MDQRESLPVSFLDFILRGLRFYAESIVELCFCYHYRQVVSRMLSVEVGAKSMDAMDPGSEK